MSQTYTIGIRGNGPGAGKDTAANIITDFIREKWPAKVVRHEKFATPIRECVESITGITVEESQTVEGKNVFLKSMNMTVGKFLQQFGVEMVKNNTYENVWVDALFRRFNSDEIVVISDVRFPNEQEAVKNRNGIIIEILSEMPVNEKALAGRDMTHSTETALDGIKSDYKIVNSELLKFKEDIIQIIDPLFL